jgi:hypothetical protein
VRPAWICLAALAGFGGCSAATPTRDASAPATASGPVVIELFTSQGCSSCPPADRWLASLEPGTVVGGRPVIPLAFHVDYWNDLGWADPFSTEAWSQRQYHYARSLGSRGAYTPEVVVAGRHDAVGSRTDAVTALIAAAPPTADLDASLTRTASALTVHAAPPPDTAVWAAVVEDGLITEVHAGENRGESLRDDHIVRALVAIPGGGVEIPLDPTWRTVRVVAFAASPDGAIVAARALR